MQQTLAEQIRNMALMLLRTLQPPEPHQIRAAVHSAWAAVSSMGLHGGESVDEEALAKEIESVLNIWVPDGTELVDPAGHVPWLHDKRPAITWDFWHRYELYLEQQKRLPPQIVARLDGLTDRVLAHLEDPARRGKWRRWGLVVGQVQSGKTGNYTGLICKAVDSGYKLVIVLAGSTNSLRSQTQLRLDEGFLGYDTQQSRVFTQDSAKMGVGFIVVSERRLAVHSPTTSADDGDFKSSTAKSVAMYIGSDPVILVVKKNGSILRNLVRWVQARVGERDQDGNWSVKGLPVLLLDDEADNASINTKELERDGNGNFKEEQDLTAINKRIRELLNTFEQSAYVGYTATPFANIFIPPDAATRSQGEDLFPRSFIINLPSPSSYIGPVQVFGLDAYPDVGIDASAGLPVVRIVDDNEDLIPSSHKSDLEPAALPESLKEAIRAFILTCAARAARGQLNVHNSMLVHVSRFNKAQGLVEDLVREELRGLRQRLEYGDGERSPKLLAELRSLWERDYIPTAASVRERIDDAELTQLAWDDVVPHLRAAALKITIKQISGNAGDILDYYDHPNGISVIAVGGDKLSRGLTLEGLTISYYLRAARMYDTLMQMGRWFGYRPGYIDLCRLYTTQELVDWFEHITLASEELRQEFDRMASAHMTPLDFGLKVQTHPGGLLVTNAGKMRYSKKVKVSFANQLVESYLLQKDGGIIEANYQQADAFIRSLGMATREGDAGSLWTAVPGGAVSDFLGRLAGHPGLPTADPRKLSEFIDKKMLHGELVTWTVALIDNRQSREASPRVVGGVELGLTLRTPDGKSTEDTYRIKNRHILSGYRLDEGVDLDEREIAEALDAAVSDWRNRQLPPPPPERPGGCFIRAARPPERGLLLIYPLNPDAVFPNGDARRNGHPIIGYAISFPGTRRPDETVEYAANTVFWREEMDYVSDEP